MKKTTYTTTRFNVDKSFYVEISYNKKNEAYDFVLCHEKYGVKMLMFSLDAPESSWEDIIRADIDNCVRIYAEEYMDEWECYEC